MDKVKIVLDRKGVMQMLKSKEAENICREFADKAAKRFGDGYEVSTYAGRFSSMPCVGIPTVLNVIPQNSTSVFSQF